MILKITWSCIVNIRFIILVFIFGSSSLPVVSQGLKTINLEEIPQRKVRKYIISRSIDQMQDFSSIHASWNKETDESDFNVNEETFYSKYALQVVWESYRHTNPSKIWNGKSFRLGLLLIKSSNSAIYVKSSTFPEIDTGQVYFLNLKLIKGLFHVPVAFDIITINPEKLIMEFSYIDNNKELGKQTIHFFDNGAGGTRIVHRSYFKSKSLLRDDFLYPYFHEKFIEDFHRNMNKLIKNTKPVINN